MKSAPASSSSNREVPPEATATETAPPTRASENVRCMITDIDIRPVFSKCSPLLRSVSPSDHCVGGDTNRLETGSCVRLILRRDHDDPAAKVANTLTASTAPGIGSVSSARANREYLGIANKPARAHHLQTTAIGPLQGGVLAFPQCGPRQLPPQCPRTKSSSADRTLRLGSIDLHVQIEPESEGVFQVNHQAESTSFETRLEISEDPGIVRGV